VRRYRARYGVDGGYGGIAFFLLAGAGLLAGERWAADARDLPFPPESFDVVLSNLTFSNIRGTEERARALREAVRVLRPSGQMRVVDDRADRYAPVLQAAGCADVEVRHLDWRTWSGLPGHHFTLVSARKPAAGSRN
jgi:SAM-dependent methyltransferase